MVPQGRIGARPLEDAFAELRRVPGVDAETRIALEPGDVAPRDHLRAGAVREGGSDLAVLAERLAALGCLGPDAPVALLLERDPSLVVGVYGALAAGGCYVPLEPDYPLERIKTVVEDAGCSVVVTQQRLVDGPLKALLGEGSVELPAVVQAVVPLKFGADDAGGLDRRPVAATIFERFWAGKQ